jgi:hypothetical protein
MPDVHWLTPGGDLRQITVVCGTRLPEYGTWDHRAVTCAACQQRGQAYTTQGAASTLSEKAWLQQVRSLARANHWMTYHPLRSQGSEPGWVDLVCLKPPVLACAELKTNVGRVTPAQQQWLDALAQVRIVQAHVWRPSDWRQVVHVLSD